MAAMESTELDRVIEDFSEDSHDYLTAQEVSDLYADLRVGGLSLAQVETAIEYTCANDTCESSELIGLLKELDRRFFLVQDLRWEFSLLDSGKHNCLHVNTAKFLMQMVHKNKFSEDRWDTFLSVRPFPEAPITFQEMEVELCSIPAVVDDTPKPPEPEPPKKKSVRIAVVPVAPPEPPPVTVEEPKEEVVVDDGEEELKRRLRRMKKEAEEKRRAQEDESSEAARKAHETKLTSKELKKQIAAAEQEAINARDPKSKREAEDKLQNLRHQYTDLRHHRIRQRLKTAIKTRHLPSLKKYVGKFRKEKLKDHEGDCAEGERLIKALTAKEKLRDAMNRRHLGDLENQIDHIRKNGFDDDCQPDLTQAELLAIRLRRLERIRAEILKLNQPTVAEIRSYQKPPIQVHKVMTATFVILGHKEAECKDWKTVQALVGKMGKLSLKRRCLELDPANVKAQLTRQAKKLIEKYELDEIRDISAGAATFYCWSWGIIEEVEHMEEERAGL